MNSIAAMRRMAYARVNLDFESRQLGKALLRLPPEIRKKVVRKGLREWGKRALRAMRRRIRSSDPEMRRDGIVKLKTYKRGKVFWAGVGVRKDGLGSGWRAHFWNNGFRVWQKGLRKDGTPKPAPKHPGRNPRPRLDPWNRRSGWRDGIKKRGLGPRIGRWLFITKTNLEWGPKAAQYVRDAIAEAIRNV